MRLNLSPSQVGSVALKCDPWADDLEKSTLNVISVLQQDGRIPYSRRDIQAVLDELQGCRGKYHTDDPTWYFVGDLINRTSKSVRRGQYVPLSYAEAPQAAAAPKPAPKAAPAPVAAESSEETLTTKFMVEAIGKGLDRRIADKVSFKFPTEDYDEILGETRLLLLSWGKKGKCDDHIKAGKPPTQAILSIWVEHNLRKRVYRKAQDALGRNKGLRTQCEIQRRRDEGLDDYQFSEVHRKDASQPQTLNLLQDDGTFRTEFVEPEKDAGLGALSDAAKALARNFIALSHPTESLRTRATNIGLKLMKAKDDTEKETLQSELNKVTARLDKNLNTVKAFDELNKARETALFQGQSSIKLTVPPASLQTVRDDLRRAPEFFRVALTILKAIHDEPYSTVQDLKDELPQVKNNELKKSLLLLKESGFIQEARGSSFFSTKKGELSVELGSLT